jgi:hypothetical protein
MYTRLCFRAHETVAPGAVDSVRRRRRCHAHRLGVRAGVAGRVHHRLPGDLQRRGRQGRGHVVRADAGLAVGNGRLAGDGACGSSGYRGRRRRLNLARGLPSVATPGRGSAGDGGDGVVAPNLRNARLGGSGRVVPCPVARRCGSGRMGGEAAPLALAAHVGGRSGCVVRL